MNKKLVGIYLIINLCLNNGFIYPSEEGDVIRSIEVIGERGEEKAVISLVELTKGAGNKVLKHIAISLGELGAPEGVPTLIELAKDKDEDVQLGAIHGLGKIQDESAVPVLLSLINPKNPRITHAVCRSLGDIGSSSAIPSLIEIAKMLSVEKKEKESTRRDMQRRAKKTESATGVSWTKCRQEAVLSLGRIGMASEEVVKLLEDSLKDEKSSVRRNASYALCLLAPPDAVSALAEAIKKKDPTIQINIKYALRIINTKEVIDKLNSLYHDSKDNMVRLLAIEILALMENDSCLPILMEATGDKNNSIRRYAIEGIGRLCKVEAVPRLCEVLKKDKDPYVRASAATALGRIKAPESLETMLEALEDKSKHVKEAVVGAIKEIGDKRALPTLKNKINTIGLQKIPGKTAQRKDMLKGSTKKQIASAPETTGKMSQMAEVVECIAVIGGKEEGQYISNLMHHKEYAIRESAVESGSYIGDWNIVNNLVNIAKDPSETMDLRTKAISTLGLIGTDDAKDCLVSLLNDEKEKIVVESVNALASLTDKDIYPYLVPLLSHKDKEVVEAAAGALAKIDAKEAFPLINEIAWQKEGNLKLKFLSYLARLLNAEDQINRDKILNEFNIALKEEFSAAGIVADLAIYAAIIAAAIVLGGTGGGGNTGGTQTHYNWYPGYGGVQHIYLYPPPSNTLANEIFPMSKGIGLVSAIQEKDRADKIIWSAKGLYELKDLQSRVLLERAMRSSYEEVRFEVAKALGELGDNRSLIPLIHYVQDINPRNRGAIAEALSKIKNKRAISYIRLVLYDEYEENRKNAILALERIGGDEAIGLIKETFNRTRDLVLWMESAGSLYALTNEVSDEVKDRIIQNLGHPLPEVRLTAVEMCKKMQIKEARDTLKKLSETDPSSEIRKTARINSHRPVLSESYSFFTSQ